MAHTRHFAASASLIAAISMAASPVAAAEHPSSSTHDQFTAPGLFDADSINVERYRHHRYRHHRHRLDAGDVIAGVLILGGIAAIASAASNNDRDRRYRDREYRSRDYDYREQRDDSRYDGARGIDRAVEICVSRIERDVRVDSVDSVDRRGEGWRVSGQLYNGEGFTCRIGPDGRIDDIDYDSVAAADDRQHSDDRYRTAWADLDRGQAADADEAELQPAYPGGPFPGEEEADDRYTIAE